MNHVNTSDKYNEKTQMIYNRLQIWEESISHETHRINSLKEQVIELIKNHQSLNQIWDEETAANELNSVVRLEDELAFDAYAKISAEIFVAVREKETAQQRTLPTVQQEPSTSKTKKSPRSKLKEMLRQRLYND